MNSLQAVVTAEQIESFHYEVPVIKKPKQHPFNVLPKAKNQQGVSGYYRWYLDNVKMTKIAAE